MPRQNGVVQFSQGMIAWQRFDVVNVDAGSGDGPLFQYLNDKNLETPGVGEVNKNDDPRCNSR